MFRTQLTLPRHDARARARRVLAALPVLALLGAALAPPAGAQSSLTLDGTNDYVTFGNTLGATTFTLECWFRRNGTGVTVSTGTGGVTAVPLVTKGRGEAETPANLNMNYFLGINGATGTLCADFEDTAGGANHPLLGVTQIANGMWHHAAATYDGTNFRLYLNGQLEASLMVGATPEASSIQHAGLGTGLTSTGGTGGFFNGNLDEVRIWNLARTQAQIQALMLSEATGSEGGLIGRWGLNEGVGASTGNSVGGGVNGTINGGAGWGPSSPFALAYALALGSANAYVTFGNTAALGLSQFTLECWLRRDGAGTGTGTGTGGLTSALPLISKGRGEAEAPANLNMNYFFGINTSTNALCADFEDTAGGANHPVQGTTAIVNGTWYHAAATYDGTTWRLYLNGLLEATLVASATPEATSIQHAGLGSAMTSNGTTAGFFNGNLDEVRIWNGARTQAQIQSDINAQLGGANPGLVARYGLNEGGGLGIASTAGPAIPGTITGTGWSWLASAPFNLVVPPAPNAPSGLAALGVTHARVTLAWTDNAANEQNLELERSTSGPGGPFAPLATLPANTTGYLDEAVSAGASYCYRLRATSAAGLSAWDGPMCVNTPNPPASAIDFGGASGYVGFGAAPALGAAQFTLECWFRRDGNGTATSTGAGGIPNAVPLLTKGRAEMETPTNLNMNYFLGIDAASGTLCADFEEGASGTTPGLNHPVFGTTIIGPGAWHHAAVTYDGTWKVYLDGQLETTLAVGQPPEAGSIQHAAIGSALNSSGTAAGFFDGVIDETRVWGVAHTHNEIQNTMNQTLAASQPGLLGCWNLNEGIGTAIGASAGTTVGGTWNGAAVWVGGAPFNLPVLRVITASAGAHGQVAPAGTVLVANGADQPFTLTPNAGYSVSALTVDGGSIAPTGSHTFLGVVADHTIDAQFADLTPPAAQVAGPNGGETLIIGGAATLQWSATDGVGVIEVDLELSRNGAAGPWEPIATAIANSGSYAWTTTGPSTTNALMRVRAHDAAAQQSEDASDQPFTIADVPTPTLLASFTCRAVAGGLELRWRFGPGSGVAEVTVERSEGAIGSWSPVEVAWRSEGEDAVMLDAGVIAGRTYAYRLVVRLEDGALERFGPVSGTAIERITAFALASAVPNPTPGALQLEIAVPQAAQVRVEVLDVSGRRVAVLADRTFEPGRHTVGWDGRWAGRPAPVGVYFARMQAGSFHASRRFVVRD